MTEKIGTIRNPLTIIAIFAGIAEVSGTVVLPFVSAINQLIFIWFLILFPALLVILFFITLNFNNKVLYAPSDFSNEENYLTVFNYDVSKQRQVEIEINRTNSIKLLTEQINNQITTLNNRIYKLEKGIVKLNYDKEIPYEKSIKIISNIKELYKYQITRFINSNEYVQHMKSLGYNFTIYDFQADRKRILVTVDYKSIWLGPNIPYDIAKEIIYESKKFYSHLEYIHISGDQNDIAPITIYDQIYIGGSTETAKDIFKLSPMSESNFKELLSKNNIEDFHKYIRSFYTSI